MSDWIFTALEAFFHLVLCAGIVLGAMSLLADLSSIESSLKKIAKALEAGK